MRDAASGKNIAKASVLAFLCVAVLVASGVLSRRIEQKETMHITQVVNILGSERYYASQLLGYTQRSNGYFDSNQKASILLIGSILRYRLNLVKSIVANSSYLNYESLNSIIRNIDKYVYFLNANIGQIYVQDDKIPAIQNIETYTSKLLSNSDDANRLISEDLAVNEQKEYHQAQNIFSVSICFIFGILIWRIILPAKKSLDASKVTFERLSEQLWKFTEVVKRTTNAVVITDLSGNIEWVNEGFERITEYSSKEALGRRPSSLLQHEGTDKATVARIRNAVARKQPIQEKISNRSKSGRIYWLELDIQPLFSKEGHHLGFLAIESDITRLIETTEQISTQNAELKLMSEMANVGVWILDLDAESLNLSDQARRIHGLGDNDSPDFSEMIGFFGASVAETLLLEIRNCIETGQDWGGEFPLVTQRGEPKTLKIYGRAVEKGGRVTGIVAAVQDITDLASARDANIAAQKRLELAAESASLGLWEWNIATEEYWTQPSWWKHFGLDVVESVLTDEQRDAFVHPDDIPKIKELRNRFIERKDKELRKEFRILDGNNSWRWIQAIGRATEFDDKGRVKKAYGVNLDIHHQKMSNEQLAYAAKHDLMTGLLNRHEIDTETNRDFSSYHRIYLLALDLDGFKQINDRYGHAAGDYVLQEVSKRIKGCIRGRDFAARMGGDEFCIVFKEKAYSEDKIRQITKRLLDTIQAPIRYNDNDLNVGVSIGGAYSPDFGKDFDSLLLNADAALYEAKASGKAQFVEFNDTLYFKSQHRKFMELELGDALNNGEFFLHYQPQLDLETSQIIGAEALLRWNSPYKGMIPPDEFIPVAEETGLIIPLGNWVIEEACMQASRWPKNLSVSVNFSAKQLGQADLYRTVTDCLAKYDLKASQLEIEVTETVLLSDDPELLKDLISLHELGVKLALDDFGTGYASLSYLQRLPFDKIKLDRSFVDTIGREDSALAIIRSTAQLARDLGMESVAEGVETTEQIEAIRSAGYSIGQGYYFGKPMPAGEFEALVRERAATRSPKAEYVI